LEVIMHRGLSVIAALVAAIAVSGGAAWAVGAGNVAKLPEGSASSRLVIKAGYKYCDYSGCYSCASRECDSYGYDYGHRYCTHYHYYDCSPYGGGYRYHGGGGGGY
jgi:hypothetical protein